MSRKRSGGWRPSRGIQIVPSGMMDGSEMAMTAAAVVAGAAAGAGFMWAAHKYNWLGMGAPAVAARSTTSTTTGGSTSTGGSTADSGSVMPMRVQTRTF